MSETSCDRPFIPSEPVGDFGQLPPVSRIGDQLAVCGCIEAVGSGRRKLGPRTELAHVVGDSLVGQAECASTEPIGRTILRGMPVLLLFDCAVVLRFATFGRLDRERIGFHTGAARADA
jgi:hypothetical protein